ncbi:MAG: orotidine-5'-phosphate decarboxylase [Oscillospiraceae bacterium]|nr:orotidine-5'-phosphate decarboxylase [Oscillospiraceae bacterium]
MDRLIERIIKTGNPTVVGLDPALDLVPTYLKEKEYQKNGETLKAAAKAVYKFNKGLIDALCPIVPAVKPQLAFYEALGVEGIKAFYKTVEYAKERGMYVIADAKRGDIGSTAEGYASAFLGSVTIKSTGKTPISTKPVKLKKEGKGEKNDKKEKRVYGQLLAPNEYAPFPADALTVNAYLGTDGVKPFVNACASNDKGIFVLVKTSNPSSGELQDKCIDGIPVYEHMGSMVENWGSDTIGTHGYSAVGAVVGATYPEQIKELRAKMPKTFFLIPGYGAQGGTAKDIAAAFDSNGLGGIVNSSRGIIAAYKNAGENEHDFAGAAFRAALAMKDDLCREINLSK